MRRYSVGRVREVNDVGYGAAIERGFGDFVAAVFERLDDGVDRRRETRI
jgi:hypothetical protein